MRLIEEKLSIQLQIISLFVLLFSTILSQIANYKIDDFNSDLEHRRSKLSEIYQKYREYNSIADTYSFYQFLPCKMRINDDILTERDTDNTVKNLSSQYINGTITSDVFIKLYKNHYREKTVKERHRYNKGARSFNDYRSKGTIWKTLRDFVFLPVQIIGISVLFIGNICLLSSISQRITKKNS